MRTAGRQPRILLTNVKRLELLLTRQQDVELFAGARLDVGAASIVGNPSQGSSASGSPAGRATSPGIASATFPQGSGAGGTPATGSVANENPAREGRRPRLGYPVCTVCGQSVSPLSSDRQRDAFRQTHTERCGRMPEGIGFHADVTADVVSLPACDSAETAYSVLETLRIGAAQVLDMHLDDLQILVIGHVDRDDVDALLWDPQAVPDESAWEWVEVETARSPRPGMFVARVVGQSMEPRIPDGA